MTSMTFEPPTIGDVIGEGRFELLAHLGDGGTSVVFRARDRVLDREVALKLLQPRYVGRPEHEQRLINEAEYLRRVQGHPHIVEYIDSGRLEDLHAWPWLATEVLSGTVLSWMLVRGRLGVTHTISVARQLLDALRRCHAEGIVHRYATPSKVFELADADKTVKLFDFSHAADFHTNFADPSMDVFGFGILLYELATGQNPYANLTDRGAFIKAQREGKLEPPRLLARAYQAPEEFAALVRDCTLRDASKRPTIDALLGRLDALALPTAQRDETATLDMLSSPRASAEAAEHMDVTPGRSEGAEATVRMDAARVIAVAKRQPEVAAPVDVAPRTTKPRRRAPEAIGDWTARPQSRAGSAAAAVTTPSSVAGEIFAPAIAEPVELAFARPPELREVAPAASLVDSKPVPNPGSAGVGDFEPRFSPEDSGSGKNERRSWWALGGVAAALGLVVTLLSWFVHSKFSGAEDGPKKKIEADRDRSTASLHDPSAGPESKGPVLDGQTGADGSDVVGKTGGIELVPEVESVEVEPQPKPRNGKPENGKPENDDDPPKDSGSTKPETAAPTKSPECAGAEDEAHAALEGRKWSRVVKLTERKACWASNSERIRLRVEALFGLGDWSACVAAGEGSKDATIRSFVDKCTTAAKLSESETP